MQELDRAQELLVETVSAAARHCYYDDYYSYLFFIVFLIL